MFANFRLKIRRFWDSDTKTVIDYTFLETKTSLSVKTISIKPLIYVKAIYGQKKTERNRFFIPCHLLNTRYFLTTGSLLIKLGNQLRFCELEM